MVYVTVILFLFQLELSPGGTLSVQVRYFTENEGRSGNIPPILPLLIFSSFVYMYRFLFTPYTFYILLNLEAYYFCLA